MKKLITIIVHTEQEAKGFALRHNVTLSNDEMYHLRSVGWLIIKGRYHVVLDERNEVKEKVPVDWGDYIANALGVFAGIIIIYALVRWIFDFDVVQHITKIAQ